MKILAIDVGGKSWGYCFKDDVAEDSGFYMTKSYMTFNKHAACLMALWKPKMVVVGKPNRYYNVISSHNRYIGILCLLCEKAGIPLIEMNDVTARATLYPGEGTKKVGMKKYFPFKQDDEIDACVLAKAWYKLNQK